MSLKGILKLTAAGIGTAILAREVGKRLNPYDFRGRVVLITGGSRGLGLVLARQLAAEGARLAICARDSDELARAAADLSNRGADVLAIECDVTSREQIQRMVRTVTARWGPVDVLINNAGVIQSGPLEVMTQEDYEEAMKVHFWGPLWFIQAVLPDMKRERSGRVVNISSIGGKISVPHLVPYCASKFALVGLSEGLRAELAKDGVVVTTVCPGLMRTGSPRNAYFKGQHRIEYAWFAISDALPLVSIDAERAARRIINACRYGDGEVVLSLQAKLAVLVHDLAPGLTADVLGLVNRALPGPGGIGTNRARGSESESALAPSLLTTLNDRAAVRNNEMG